MKTGTQREVQKKQIIQKTQKLPENFREINEWEIKSFLGGKNEQNKSQNK